MAADRPMHVLPLSGSDLGASLTPLLKDFAPDYLYGISGFVGRAAEWLDTDTARGVHGIWVCGEPLSPVLRSRFSEQFPHAPVRMEYIVTELGGPVGIACAALPPNTYHPGRGVTIEIDAPEHQSGEILITKKVNDMIAVEQYRPGDSARFIPTTCHCGESLTFEMLGRSGFDYIKITGGILVHRAELDRVISHFRSIIEDYRAEISDTAHEGRSIGTLRLRLFSVAGEPTDALKKEIIAYISRELFLTRSRTLASLVATDDFAPLEVEFCSTPFPLQNKDVKLRRAA